MGGRSFQLLPHAEPCLAAAAVVDHSLFAHCLLAQARDAWGRTALHWAVVNGHRRSGEKRPKTRLMGLKHGKHVIYHPHPHTESNMYTWTFKRVRNMEIRR